MYQTAESGHEEEDLIAADHVTFADITSCICDFLDAVHTGAVLPIDI